MTKYKKLQNKLIVLRARVSKISRRRLFFGAAFVLALIVVGGFYYYTSSSRVLNDVLAKSVAAKSMDFSGAMTLVLKGEESVKIISEFNGSSTKNKFAVSTETKTSIGAVDVNIDLDFAADQEAMYFKLNNASELAETVSAMLDEDPSLAEYQSFADRLDGTWIKMDNQINNEFSACSLDDINSIAASEQDALRRVFEQNQFIEAERSGFGLTEQEYDLSFDEAAAKKFSQELMRTEYFKKLEEKCGFSTDSSTTPTENPLEKADINAKIWVNPWTHKLKRFMISAKSDDVEFALEVSVNLGKKVDVYIPTHSTLFEELLQEPSQDGIPEESDFRWEIDDADESAPEPDSSGFELQSTPDNYMGPTTQEPQHLEVRP